MATGDGDLTKKLAIKNQDEIGDASHEINQFIDKVQSTIKLAKETSSENASIAHELSATTLQVGKRVEDFFKHHFSSHTYVNRDQTRNCRFHQ